MNKIPLRNSGYRLEEMDGELLLYNPTETRTIYLNETASLIWRLCDGELTTQEIIQTLTDTYPESSGSINNDVTGTLEELRSLGALSLT